MTTLRSSPKRPPLVVLHGSRVFLALILGVFLITGCGEASYSAEEHVTRAQQAYTEGKLKQAIIEIKNALQQEPGSAEARQLLGEYSLELGRAEEAEAELLRAEELGGDPSTLRPLLLRAWLMQGKNEQVIKSTATTDAFDDAALPVVLTLRAQALLREKRLEEARTALNQALELEPTSAEALLGLAWTEWLGENPEAARSNLRAALENDPDLDRAWELLGDIERNAGQLEEADTAYTKALEATQLPFTPRLKRAMTRLFHQDFEGAEQDVQVLRERFPEQPAVNYISGLIAFYQQRYEDARTELEAAVSQDPNYAPALYYLGATQYALQNWQQAESYLGRYVRRFPGSSEAARLLALTRLQEGDSERAEKALNAVLQRDPEDQATLAMMSNLYLAQGRPDEALHHLRKIIAMEPDSAATRARLGLALVQDGQREEGFDELDRAIEMAPEASLRLEIAIILERIRAGEHQQALERVDKLYNEEKIPAALYYNLKGIAHYGLGDPDAAESAFREGIAAAPDKSSDLANNLIRLLVREGRKQEAEALAQESLEKNPEHLGLLISLARMKAAANDLEETQALLERALSAHPEALRPRLALAELYLRTNRPDQAVTLLSEWEGHSESGENTSPPPQWLSLMAQALLNTGDEQAAIDRLRQLHQLQPNAANISVMLARLERKQGNRIEARELLEEALALQPGHLESRLMLVAMLTQEGEFERAAEVLAPARSAHPDHPQVLAQAGAVAYSQGLDQEALAHLQRAAELAPDDRSIIGNLAQAQHETGNTPAAVETLGDWLDRFPEDQDMRLLRASLLLDLGREQDAINAYQHYLASGRENVIALNNLAWLLRESNTTEALSLAERAAALAPESGEILDTQGVIQLAAGDKRAAIDTLRRALKLNPELASARLNLAKALLAEGQQEEALRQLETLISRHPDTKERQEAEQLMQQAQ